jgi:hypothetical protein
VSSDPYDNYDLENELVIIYIDLGIEFDDVETGDEVYVSEILQTSITKDTDEGVREYDFNISTLCEDFTCCSHSLYLVATTNFKTVIGSGRCSSFKVAHEKAFGKLQGLWNLSNRSVKAS